MKLLQSRTFAWWEMGIVKVCLLSLGILLGLYFYPYLVGLIPLWWVLFVATTLYFVPRIFSGN
ncbi:MAG: hypothetical protein KGI60_02350 [Patescibacteria group bacterium]|nr:hypothetical protein [Patescibacteria group bacterium]